MNRKWFALPYLVWMILFTVVPLILILIYAIFTTNAAGDIVLSSANLLKVFSPENLRVLLRSLYFALLTTVICLLLAYPAALLLSKLRSRMAGIVSLLFMLPMWMNFLLRTYAWRALLDLSGPINVFLGWLGIEPQQMLFTQGAVVLGLVYNFLPFMLLPIYTVCSKINESHIEAAEDLGANKWQVLLRVKLPLSRPGIITGVTMVFMPAVTTFIISRLLGGSMFTMFGELIETQFMQIRDWNFGSALAVVMMILLVISMAVMRKYDKDGEGQSPW